MSETEELRDTTYGKRDASDDTAVSSEDLAELLRSERARSAQVAAEAAQLRTRADRAETELTQVRGKAATAEEAQAQSERARVATAIQVSEAEISRIKGEIAAHNREGRYEEAAESSGLLGEVIARRREETNYASYLDVEASKAEEARKNPPPPPPKPQGIDLSRFSRKQRDWIEDNPDYMTDEKFRARVARAHGDALDDGISLDSPEYFDFIDGRTGKGKPTEAPRKPRAPSAELPVQRRSAEPGAREGGVRLSPEQREAADFTLSHLPESDYMENGTMRLGRYAQYAQNVASLKKQGRM